MPSLCWNTLLIDGTDVREFGEITSAEGLLAEAPQKGDLVELDFHDGAQWAAGPKGPFTFEVPLILTGGTQDVKLGNLRQLQALVGVQRTLIRRLTVDGADIADTCQAVLVNAVQVRWDFEQRGWIYAVLLFQALGPWSPA